MEHQIRKYLDLHNILPACQAGYSTATALTQVTDSIVSNTDNKESTALVALDFFKAFDTINRNLLVAKLKYYKFSAESRKLIRSYLSGRSQRVSIDNQISTLKDVNSGVPQRSILGAPTFYFVFLRYSKFN